MEVSLERINEDYLFEVTNSKGMSIHLDNNSKQNGEVKGLSPMELLLMGVAGCSSIDIVAILEINWTQKTIVHKILHILTGSNQF